MLGTWNPAAVSGSAVSTAKASLQAVAGSGDSDVGPASTQRQRQFPHAPPAHFFSSALVPVVAAAAATRTGPSIDYDGPLTPSIPDRTAVLPATAGWGAGGWSTPCGGVGISGSRLNAGEAIDIDLHLNWATVTSAHLLSPQIPDTEGSQLDFSPALIPDGRPDDRWLGNNSDDTDWSSMRTQHYQEFDSCQLADQAAGGWRSHSAGPESSWGYSRAGWMVESGVTRLEALTDG
jgi:hypothetical protein